jgi:hypothetical protein
VVLVTCRCYPYEGHKREHPASDVGSPRSATQSTPKAVRTMPYVSRSYLDEPSDGVIWRYMSLEKLLGILILKSLFFPSAHTLREKFDKFEGALTDDELATAEPNVIAFHEKTHQKPTEQRLFFNCWHMNEAESDAMWKIYVGNNGVAIKSTVNRLKQCFGVTPLSISLGRILYGKTDDHTEHSVRRFMRKKPAFRHEEEIRLVMYDETSTHVGQSGIPIPADVEKLIEKIVVS